MSATDSTNLEAKRRIAAGARHGELIVARKQTEGRGRLGRSWASLEGGLYMSLILFPALDEAKLPRLGAAVAFALTRALGSLAPEVPALIKWPNDIVAHGKKLAGILLEAGRERDASYVVAGVGVNVAQEAFPDDLSHKAASLLMLGANVDPLALAAAFGHHAIALCESVGDAGAYAELMSAYAERSATLGRAIVAHTPEGEIRGTARTLTEDGSLTMMSEDGRTLTLASGEVSVRGLLGYAD